MAAAFQIYAVVLWAVLAALFLVLAASVIVLQRRVTNLVTHYDRITAGVADGTLRGALERYIGRLDEATGQVEMLTELCRTVEDDLRQTIQRVGIVRFNPFADTGGDQSFAVALLDANGSGVVISSLFSRASTRVFAKSVVDGKSTHVLTDEEVAAIEQAMTTRELALKS